MDRKIIPLAVVLGMNPALAEDLAPPEVVSVPADSSVSSACDEFGFFARGAVGMNWSGFLDGSLKYRSGLVADGTPSVPPLGLQGELGLRPCAGFPLSLWGEAGVSFSGHGSGFERVGGGVQVEAFSHLVVGLNAGGQFTPSEPASSLLQGVPYLGLSAIIPVKEDETFSWGVGLTAQQTFPAPNVMGFDLQRGMFGGGIELHGSWNGKAPFPTGNRTGDSAMGAIEENNSSPSLKVETGKKSVVLPVDAGPKKSNPGEATRLRDDMKNHSKENTWKAVETSFDYIPEPDRNANDYYIAAQAARATGDIALMLSRLEKAKGLTAAGSPPIDGLSEWLEQVKNDYAYVRLEEGYAFVIKDSDSLPFDVTQRAVVDLLRKRYANTGSFEGFIPLDMSCCTLGGAPFPELQSYAGQPNVQVLSLDD